MPIINYICEKSGKNIYASIQYIKAILGCGQKYNYEKCCLYLTLIDNTAVYSLELV